MQSAIQRFVQLIGFFEENFQNFTVRLIQRFNMKGFRCHCGRSRFGGGFIINVVGYFGISLTLQKTPDFSHHGVGPLRCLRCPYGVQLHSQLIVSTIKQVKNGGLNPETTIADVFVQGFQFVTQVGHGADLSHARAAFQGVQLSL